ncbi:MAG: hypothetical protein ABEN55_11350, partial [Bradymonadaceae bacterium]
GTYQEDVLVNTRNVAIQGHGDVTLKGNGSRPALMVTNMTESGADAFETDGGYSFSESGGFTYDGADTDRAIRSDLSHDDPGFGFRLEGVTLKKGTSSESLVVLPSEDGNTESVIGDVHLERCELWGELRLKNVDTIECRSTQIHTGATTVFDNCGSITIPGDVDSGDNLGVLVGRFNDVNLAPAEVKPKGIAPTAFFNRLDGVFNYIHLYCGDSTNTLGHKGQGAHLRSNGQDASGFGVVLSGAGHFGSSLAGAFGDVTAEKKVEFAAGGNQHARRVQASQLTKSNAGTANVDQAIVRGGVSVAAGTLTIRSGEIEGAVTAEGSSTADIRHAHIASALTDSTTSLEVGASSSATIKGRNCTIQGKPHPSNTASNAEVRLRGCELDNTPDGAGVKYKMYGGSYTGTPGTALDTEVGTN